jgi:hypothetical protein
MKVEYGSTCLDGIIFVDVDGEVPIAIGGLCKSLLNDTRVLSLERLGRLVKLVTDENLCILLSDMLL